MASKTLRTKKVPVSPYARALRLRLYPSAVQERQLLRNLGASRHIWNWALAQCKEALAKRERIPSAEDLMKRLTAYKAQPERAWLGRIPTDVLQQTLRDLGLAISAWRAGLHRFPRKKKRGCATGIRFVLSDRRPQDKRTGSNPRIDISARTITLTGLGAVRWRGSRDRLPVGDIAMATVRRQGDQWFVTLPQRDAPAPEVSIPIVDVLGLDLGVRDAVVTSLGAKTPSPKPLTMALGRLKRYQRRYARQRAAAMVRAGIDPKAPIPKGTRFVRKGKRRRKLPDDGRKTVVLSNRTVQTERQITRLYAKVANQRTEFQHQTTRALVDAARVIAIEDLNLRAMSRALRKAFRRSVADVGLGEIRRQITYKAGWAAREIITIDRWFPSSQLCSSAGCDYRNSSLTLKDRVWTCPQCGTTHDRDTNAARNIRDEGTRLLAMRCTPRSGGIDARGDAASTAIGQPRVGPTSVNREPGYRAAKQRTHVSERDGSANPT